MTTQPTCKQRVRAHYRDRMTDLTELLYAARNRGAPCRVCNGTGIACDCRDCAVCHGERVICGKCGMCARCHEHKPGCTGCTHYDCDYCSDGTYPEDDRLNEYGLCVDYVAPGTFNGQRRGYLRYQLSWGGPSDEFRYFLDERRQPVRIEYWFLDWFDGAKVTVKPNSPEWETLCDLFADWDDCGMITTWLEANDREG